MNEKNSKIRRTVFPALCLLPVLITACGRENLPAPAQATADDGKQLVEEAFQTYESGGAESIVLGAEKAVQINEPGVYAVSGQLTDGQILVDCDGSVALILCDVEISNSSGAAIRVENAEKALIGLPEGSTATLVSGEETADNSEEDASGAVLYAKNDLVIAGAGSLTVRGYINNGIAAKETVTVLGGALDVQAVNHAVKGENAIEICGGELTLTAGSPDAATEPMFEATEIPAERPDMPMSQPPEGEKNFAMNDRPMGGDPGGQRPDGERPDMPAMEMPEGDFSPEKRGDALFGDMSRESTGGPEGLKSEGNITVSGGSVTVSAEGDGIQAADTITITGGTVNILRACEGLEAHVITISGGEISVNARDDGMNASGEGDRLPVLEISGGNIYVNASGDGLDSNGDLLISGGCITVDGPTSGGDGALDSGMEAGGSLTCTGGTVFAIGASNMAETFEKSSTQTSFFKVFDRTLPAGTEITVSDESGDVLFTHTALKSFDSLVFTDSHLIEGKKYTVALDDTVVEACAGQNDGQNFGVSSRRF